MNLAANLKAMGRAEPAFGHLAHSKSPVVDAFRPITSAPVWRGECLARKRIIVCPEQGWGDQIMWGRYLPRLRDAGADVAVVCHPKLGRLFELAGFWTRAAYMDRPIPVGDYWTLFGMLPKLLNGPLPRADYLAFRKGAGGGIGVVPSGNPAHFNDLNRSLPSPEAARLLRLGRDLRPEATGLYDFAETAELIVDLDLVITVDTAIAHLAGALGKACWVLLPQTDMDRRWGDGVSSPWYPDFRLFRQPAPGQWSAVLDAMEREIRRTSLTSGASSAATPFDLRSA